MSQTTTESPPATSNQVMFEILGSAAANAGAARLGRLAFVNGNVMKTPNYLAVASRGVIPHLTPDNVSRYTEFGAAYMALEDFLDKKDVPVWKLPQDNPRNLHQFTAFPRDRALVLGPRRFPAVTTPVGNGPKHMSIFTSTGFRNLTVPEFVHSVKILQPDIAIPPADLFHTSVTPPSKRQIRMTERTEEWVDEFLQLTSADVSRMGVSVFAPVLPVEYPIQWDYLRHLDEDVGESISGLAIYDVNILPELANYPSLLSLARLAFGPSKSPHDLLRQTALGVDVCTVPFVNTVSDAGIALTFTFPPPQTEGPLPLGIDMWGSDHITKLEPLAEGCKCYTCSKHHKAFLKHLLNAKEMLGWNLLQIHNHWVLGEFFAGIREALQEGTDRFEELRSKFAASYELEFPQGTGERPRARGYHFKSIAGQAKINEPSWQAYDAQGGPLPVGDGSDLHLEPAAMG